jgi:hypothetical protein
MRRDAFEFYILPPRASRNTEEIEGEDRAILFSLSSVFLGALGV